MGPTDALATLVGGAAWRDVLDGPAGARAAPLLRRTPLVPAPRLAARIGAPEAWIKAEALQRTGSFKLRGAAARLAALPAAALGRGVVAASAGNHGLGVAHAARAFGVRATVVVPRTAPAVKRAGISALGAEVLVEGAGYDAAEAAARALAAARDALFVSPFDDEHVIAGNGGTLGRELADALAGGAGPADLVVLPVGGGGLAAGLAGALRGRGAALVGAQPAANCAMRRSLERGRALVAYPEGLPTLAEGLEGAVAERTYACCRDGLAAIALVDEPAIRRALAWSFRELGLVVEPSSAVALAALLEGAVEPHGRRVVWIATGGNVEPDELDRCLAEPRP